MSVPAAASPVHDLTTGVRVAVVVLTFAPQPGMLEQAVDALRRTAGVGGSGASLDSAAIEIVVVDNGGSASRLLGEFASDAAITVLPQRVNRGYAGGMNAGLQWARQRGAHVAVLLNDDVTVRDGWLPPLVAALVGPSTPRVGAAQPLLLTAGADPDEVNSAGVQLDRYGAGSDIDRGLPLASIDGVAARPLEYFTGGAIALRLDMVDEIGEFDERFFLYYEDVDLSARGKRAGWNYLLVPESRVDHVGSASAAALGDRQRYLQERNRLWCAALHGDARLIASAVGLSVRRLRHAPRSTHARALVAGIVGMAPRLTQRCVARKRRRPSTGFIAARRVEPQR